MRARRKGGHNGERVQLYRLPPDRAKVASSGSHGVRRTSALSELCSQSRAVFGCDRVTGSLLLTAMSGTLPTGSTSRPQPALCRGGTTSRCKWRASRNVGSAAVHHSNKQDVGHPTQIEESRRFV